MPKPLTWLALKAFRQCFSVDMVTTKQHFNFCRGWKEVVVTRSDALTHCPASEQSRTADVLQCMESPYSGESPCHLHDFLVSFSGHYTWLHLELYQELFFSQSHVIHDNVTDDLWVTIISIYIFYVMFTVTLSKGEAFDDFIVFWCNNTLGFTSTLEISQIFYC